MNTKNNKRRRDTRDRIERVFIEFLQKRELDEVSVSDICKAAEINRSTFYANYADIYELADKIRDKLEGEVGQLYAAEKEQGFNSNDFLRLFRHISENQLFYRTFFKLGYDNNYQIKLYDVHQAERDFDNRHIEYHIEFFKSGFNAIVKLWLKNGCIETPEEMDEILRSEYQGRAGEKEAGI